LGAPDDLRPLVEEVRGDADRVNVGRVKLGREDALADQLLGLFVARIRRRNAARQRRAGRRTTGRREALVEVADLQLDAFGEDPGVRTGHAVETDAELAVVDRVLVVVALAEARAVHQVRDAGERAEGAVARVGERLAETGTPGIRLEG